MKKNTKKPKTPKTWQNLVRHKHEWHADDDGIIRCDKCECQKEEWADDDLEDIQ